MFSRAHLLLKRDYDRLTEQNLWGIDAHPLQDDNLFEWTARILGLKGTPWEGGVFRLYIKFDENYNARPPEVCFHTIPFHPNVHMITGKPCIDFLDDWSQWRETYSLSYILLSVQLMLSNPVLTDAINIEAVDMILNSPHAYKQMVQDCVAASQRVEAGLNPHTVEAADHRMALSPTREDTFKQQQANQTPGPPKASKVSFEDYHLTWTGIATSKAKQNMDNPLLAAIKDNPTLQAAHYGLPDEDLKLQMQKQLQEHNTLMYGKFKNKPKSTEEDQLQAKLDRVNQMRKIYLQPRTPRKSPANLLSDGLPPLSRGLDAPPGTAAEEPWEKEVDDLVAWTNNLNEEMI